MRHSFVNHIMLTISPKQGKDGLRLAKKEKEA